MLPGQLLTETGNPNGPKGFIGGPGKPVLVKDVVRGIAQARKTTLEAVVQTVQANLAELIRDDPWLADTYGTGWENRRTVAGQRLPCFRHPKTDPPDHQREPTRSQRCRCAQMRTIQVGSDLKPEEKCRFATIPAHAATMATRARLQLPAGHGTKLRSVGVTRSGSQAADRRPGRGSGRD
jgi:hypothetical protein